MSPKIINNKSYTSFKIKKMKLIIEILLMGLAVVLAAFLIPGVQVDGFLSAIIAGILIALANATIGFLLRILTFPINFLTLGLMSFIITVLMVLLVDGIMDGFNTSGFFSAMLFAIVLAVIKIIFGSFNKEVN
jgi:putative membrane protein